MKLSPFKLWRSSFHLLDVPSPAEQMERRESRREEWGREGGRHRGPLWEQEKRHQAQALEQDHSSGRTSGEQNRTSCFNEENLLSGIRYAAKATLR